MMLAAAKGSRITIDTTGDDEEAAMTALVELIANRFDEAE
jgi:phosphocarrier protein